MKFFAATLLATAVFGVSLTAQGGLPTEVKKQVRGAVRDMMGDQETIGLQEVKDILRAEGAPKELIKAIAAEFKQFPES